MDREKPFLATAVAELSDMNYSPICSQPFISPLYLEFKVMPWINKCNLALLSTAFNIGKIFCQFCCFCESKGGQALIGFHSLVV